MPAQADHRSRRGSRHPMTHHRLRSTETISARSIAQRGFANGIRDRPSELQGLTDGSAGGNPGDRSQGLVRSDPRRSHRRRTTRRTLGGSSIRLPDAADHRTAGLVLIRIELRAPRPAARCAASVRPDGVAVRARDTEHDKHIVPREGRSPRGTGHDDPSRDSRIGHARSARRHLLLAANGIYADSSVITLADLFPKESVEPSHGASR